MDRPVIVLVADHYLPAYKAGGPIRSLSNLVARLGDEFDFRVLTRDRDLGDPRPLPGIVRGRWVERDGHRVRYLAPGPGLPLRVRRALGQVPYDLIYLNSLFSPFTLSVLLLRRTGLLPRAAPVVLTPRGELAAGALRLKPRRKRVFLILARWLGLYRGLVWQATSEIERSEVARFTDAPCHIAANVPASAGASGPELEARPDKRRGAARFAFVGRIARNKNLDYALRILTRVHGEVVFDVYGTAEDEAYLEQCLGLIGRLPPNVRCAYRGPLRPDAVPSTLARYHFFLYPSFNESFGHAIYEAMLAGLPVLISDGTFWVGLKEKGAGYDTPLADEDAFAARVQEFVDLDAAEYDRLSRSVLAFAEEFGRHSPAARDHRRLFRAALGRHAPPALPGVARG